MAGRHPTGRGATRRSPASRPGRIRIIGGRWRGRRLPVTDLPGLRPTPDRVRETLFNWLAPAIAGARCLDLFAGSGALGFEAASRGAGGVVLVDRHPRAVAHLREVARALEGPAIEVRLADALAWLEQAQDRFDVVFLDPPFGQGLIAAACGLLEARGLVADRGLVYLESEATLLEPPLPPSWAILRSGRAGEVRYHLARRGAAETAGG